MLRSSAYNRLGGNESHCRLQNSIHMEKKGPAQFYSKAVVYLRNQTMAWLVTSDRYFLEVHSL